MKEDYNFIINYVNLLIKEYKFNNEEKIYLSKIKAIIKKLNNKQELTNEIESEYIYLNQIITKFIESTLLNESIDSLNIYINKNILNKQENIECINEIKKISNFFNYFNIIPTPDIYIKIIKNNKVINDNLKIITSNNKEVLFNGKINSITNDQHILQLIEIYCMINNINIKDDTISDIDYNDNMIETNIVKTYLKEIAKPLLTPEEEKDLAYKMAAGDKAAKDLFYERNLRLVVPIARYYCNRGLPFLDLIQEGNIGLMTAVNKFDVTLGNKFSTYAVNWIRNYIVKALATSARNIRLPIHTFDKISKFTAIKNNLQSKLNREATLEEIADELNISIEEATNLAKWQNDTLSLNYLMQDSENSTLEDFIPITQKTTEEVVQEKLFSKEIHKLLLDSNLTKKEIIVLYYRYGFCNGEPESLETVGNRLNITRERVRQIEYKALTKIRKSQNIKDFFVYAENSNIAMYNLDTFREPSIIYDEDNEYESLDKCKTPYWKEIKSIYQVFYKYSKKEVDSAINQLSDIEKQILYYRYGEDLENPKTSYLWKKEFSEKFYRNILPKIRRLLENPKGKLYTPRDADYFFRNFKSANILIKKDK